MSNESTTGCCASEFDPNSLTVEQARARILDLVTPVGARLSMDIRQALGYVLAEDIHSTINVPPHTNSAMDGYAVRGADLPTTASTRLTVIGKSFAGIPFAGEVQAGQCVRIMTGAVVPPGADTVIMQEHTEAVEDDIIVQGGHQVGQNVRHPGEDIAIGDVVLAKGRRLLPVDIGILASMGLPQVHVWRRPRVAFFSTGDELCDLGGIPQVGQIYDSNRYVIAGMLARLDLDILDMGIIPDRREAIEQAFHEAAGIADVVITSGGVSVGEADFVKETLDAMGSIDFWKIAMKPGRPLAVGKINDAIFFGLPGNPVSAMVTFYQFARPALIHMQGETPKPARTLQVRCINPLKKRPGRTDYQRGILEHNAQGELIVHTTGVQGSHVLTSMSRANCFIILPLESGNLEAGTLVEVQPFDGLI